MLFTTLDRTKSSFLIKTREDREILDFQFFLTHVLISNKNYKNLDYFLSYDIM